MAASRRLRFLKRGGAAVLFMLLGAIFVALLTPRVLHVERLKARRENLIEDLKKIRRDNQRSETELRLLREDPVYLEKVARDKFNKAKEGEIVYKIVREGDEAERR